MRKYKLREEVLFQFVPDKNRQSHVRKLQSCHDIVFLDLVREWLPEVSSGCVSVAEQTRSA